MLLLKFILAFCSLSYELLLAQGLSAFLDNTVLRYSTTIGLYMFTMGIGALVTGRIDMRRPALVLWQAQILLALSGLGGVISLFLLSGFGTPTWLVVVWAYALVSLIGFLTGLELPLILVMSDRRSGPSRHRIIAVDYAGAFAGTIAFVFLFYSWLGLVRSTMAVVLLNVLAAVFIAGHDDEDFAKQREPAILAALLLVGAVLALFLVSGQLENNLLAVYLRQGN
ncbi:MAG: hypothetical protein HQL22_05265 [Candidatus Omnitrophica bacterium]|nr:hypothetical protein [Candidatus Omnitrophota bacterium]